MKRHDDAAVGQRPADDVRELGADQQQVMDMHHVRPELGQQLHQVRNDPVEVDLAHVETVEVAGPQQHFVCRIAEPLEARAGPDLAMDLVGRAEEERLVAGALVGAEKVVREDLGTAGMEGRMVVRDYKDTHAYRWAPRHSAT